MAHFCKTIDIEVDEAFAWDALRDLGALHTRLVKGFVLDCVLEGAGTGEDQVRTVTFANRLQARERIIDVDDAQRRVAWSATGGRLSHHNASAQVQPIDRHRVRILWTVDLLPHAMAQPIAGMVDAGLQAMKRTLEERHRIEARTPAPGAA